MDIQSKKAKGCLRRLRYVFIGLILISILLYVFFLRGAIEEVREINRELDARELGLAFFTYSYDHHGKYPDGKSSTEVFQKLLDGGYLKDDLGVNPLALDILYYPMPGKVKAASGAKILKPENICWDVTCCLDSNSPDALPIIFLTGYKVSYASEGSAVRLPHPPRTWLEWLEGKNYPDSFIVANFKSNSSMVLDVPPNGTVTNFISPNFFDPYSKTYHQLTPDGELVP